MSVEVNISEEHLTTPEMKDLLLINNIAGCYPERAYLRSI